ncbi:hypothetical protein HK098_004645, partial [Nowakowskiella sp. JEL0407]
MKDLVVEEGKIDNVLLEWDTVIEFCENGSKQLVVPIFIHDENGPLDFAYADLAMKPLRAKDCNRTAKQIWEWFKDNQGRKIDLRDSNQVELFVLKVQQ